MFQEGREMAQAPHPEIDNKLNQWVERGLSASDASEYLQREQSIVDIWDELERS